MGLGHRARRSLCVIDGIDPSQRSDRVVAEVTIEEENGMKTPKDAAATLPGHYSEPPSYLDWSGVGRGSGWRYLGGVALILGGGILFGVLCARLMATVGDPAAAGPVGALFLDLAFFIPFLVGTLLVVRFLHRRPALTVITPFRRPNWRLFALGAGLWLAAMVATAKIMPAVALFLPGSGAESSGDIRWNYQPWVFWPALALACTLLVVQTSAEELFFRGYLLQWFAKLSRNVWVMATFSGLIFGAGHLWNPEVASADGLEWILALVIYAASGFAWAVVSIRSGTIELALGAHWVNNLFVMVLISGEDSALGATSLWVVTDPAEPDLLAGAVSESITAAVFILLASWIRGRGQLRPIEPALPGGGTVPRPPHAPGWPPAPGWASAHPPAPHHHHWPPMPPAVAWDPQNPYAPPIPPAAAWGPRSAPAQTTDAAGAGSPGQPPRV